MEIKLHLFIGKVRYKIQYKTHAEDEWTEPEIFTEAVLEKICNPDDTTMRKVQFVPLEGKRYFVLLGVGNVSKFDLDFKKTTIMKSAVIAVDFDGTVVTHEFPKIGKDIGAVPVLKRLVESGHKLILYTMRSDCDMNSKFSVEYPEIINGTFLTDAVNWFKENGIELYAIQRNPEQDGWTTSPKCYAQLYIDDAAMGAPVSRDEKLSNRVFIDWQAVEMILEMDGYLEPTTNFTRAMRQEMLNNNQTT